MFFLELGILCGKFFLYLDQVIEKVWGSLKSRIMELISMQKEGSYNSAIPFMSLK